MTLTQLVYEIKTTGTAAALVARLLPGVEMGLVEVYQAHQLALDSSTHFLTPKKSGTELLCR